MKRKQGANVFLQQRRLEQYPKVFQAFGFDGILCIPCNKEYSFKRDTLDYHLMTDSHQSALERWNEKHPEDIIPDYTEKLRMLHSRWSEYPAEYLKYDQDARKTKCHVCDKHLSPTRTNLMRHVKSPRHIRLKSDYEMDLQAIQGMPLFYPPPTIIPPPEPVIKKEIVGFREELDIHSWVEEVLNGGSEIND